MAQQRQPPRLRCFFPEGAVPLGRLHRHRIGIFCLLGLESGYPVDKVFPLDVAFSSNKQMRVLRRGHARKANRGLPPTRSDRSR